MLIQTLPLPPPFQASCARPSNRSRYRRPAHSYEASSGPPRIGVIRLSVAETARLTLLARQATAGLITRTRLAFALRWSARRRRHQAIAHWHHHSARLLAAAT